MIESEKVTKILYGGDYNPEQWPEEVWAQDMRLFKEAHIDVVTLKVCLATSTAAHPAWMARKYPDILRTEKNGMKIWK